MVDYPYDALAAASVRIKDITSCAQNRKVLHRIKNNDTAVTSLYIEEVEGDDYFGNFYARDGNELGWLGYFIGENETLKSLGVCHLPACSNEVEIFSLDCSATNQSRKLNFLEKVSSVKELYQ